MRVFDYPVIDVNCTHRSTSATPLQSLTMINSQFLMSSAEHLAKRVASEAGNEASLPDHISMAYRLAFSREATPSELSAAAEHVEKLSGLYSKSGSSETDSQKRSLENFVHMLLCSNEFLYVD